MRVRGAGNLRVSMVKDTRALAQRLSRSLLESEVGKPEFGLIATALELRGLPTREAPGIKLWGPVHSGGPEAIRVG